MTFSFGTRSLAKLAECDPHLQTIAQRVMRSQVMDFAATEGHRGQADQDRHFDAGRSKVRFPNSKHNAKPSRAIHLLPYPIDWHDLRRFDRLSGLVAAAAAELYIACRWGGDWDSDGDLADQSFNDLAHYELTGDTT